MKDIDARETQQITLGQGGAPFKCDRTLPDPMMT